MKFQIAVFLAVVAAPCLFSQNEWQGYSNDPGGQRYSALSQINTRNVAKLKLAWQYGLDPASAALNPAARGGIAATEAVPIMVGGILYTPTVKHTIVALEPETGKEIWKYELGRTGAPLRGVTWWPGDASHPSQIMAGTSDGKLIALNAKTGKLVPGFGNEGVVNLRPGVADKFPNAPYHMSSPGAVFHNMIVTGAQGQEENPDGPAMDIRAWDLRDGKLLWTFHTLPHPGEEGYETWPKDNWINGGSPANWGAMTIDTQRGLAFLPIGQPASQYYGGARHGNNLFSSSIVALDLNTGKLRWYFQLTHHDLWDYDAEAAPALIDVVHNGKKIPAVVAISKISLMFFLDRETGKPIYPVEERPVPQSDIPGEETSKTQPFPLKPPPLARLSIKPDEIFTGEPEHEKFCRDLVDKIGGIHNEGPYTPYSSKEIRIVFPGQQGGANYGGVSVDPKLGYVFVNTRDVGGMGRMDKSPDTDAVGYRRFSPLGRGTHFARFWDPVRELPCQPTPWAQLYAVKANTAEIAWHVPLGTSDELEAKGVHNTGTFGQGGSIATGGGLVFIAGTIDKRLRAFESKSGKMLWETKLDAQGQTNPMTYMGHDGKQYVVITSTGLNAYRLD
ncbi:MAG TPA: pyrroloquinoline quinone-dependent dehydrogenase [Bryobacteraceae bacterium]|jgi:quinoprotein glucose dehydrogenase|nr:pyrroloquinoline quinone-dependent dehydrogenase [Bryobacteraceae bacterium]